MSATYLSFAIIKLSNKISGVMDQSSRPTAAYRQTTHIFRINMYDYDVNVSQDKKDCNYYNNSLHNERTITACCE